MFKGIDVSKWQGNIDWYQVKPNIDFAMIRAGFGKGNVDCKAIQNMDACVTLDIPFGVYWFSYALSPEMARKEAQYCISVIGDRKLGYPVVFDFEYDSANHAESNGVKVTRKFVQDCTAAFCEELEKAGFYAMFYTNADYYNRYYQQSKIVEKYDMWYARYADEPGRACYLWQNSDKAFIPGISGKVDTDISFRNYPVIMDKMI